MPVLPIPIVSSLVLGFLLVRMVLVDRRHTPLALLLALAAVQGVVIALAMVINMVVAGLAGTAIPVILDKMGIDPALASGAFVTTVTDVVGFFAFLGLAAVILL